MPSTQELMELMASRLIDDGDVIEITPAPVEKHLSGRHDQMSHGHGGGGKYGPGVPDPPGTVKLGPGEVRGYHYTSAANADRIREEGLKPGGSGYHGSQYGEPDLVWGYERPRSRTVDNEEQVMVEYIQRPAESHMFLPPGSGQMASYDPIPKKDIIAVHEAWHFKYRYMVDEGVDRATIESVLDVKGGGYAEAARRLLADIDAGRVSMKAIEEKYAGQPRDRRGRFAGGSTHPARRLSDELRKQGGFTYRVTSGYEPKSGRMVAESGHEEMIHGKARPADIRRYLAQNRDLLKSKDVYVGGWYNPEDGTTYLDISKRYRTDSAARRASVRNKQEAYFDLETGETIYVRARGKSLSDAIRQALAARAVQAGDERRGDPEDPRRDVPGGLAVDALYRQEKYAAQPRDQMGRWTSGGGGGVGTLHMEAGVAQRLANGQSSRVSPERVAGVLEATADGPTANLERLHVNGEPNMFDRHLTDFSRSEMPQVTPEAGVMARYHEHLRSKGIKMREEEVDPRTLTASQNELDAAKVGQICRAIRRDGRLPGANDRILVSREGGILDGHHRWAAYCAAALESPDIKIKVLRLNVDIHTAIGATLEFTRKEGIAPKPFGAKAMNWFKSFKAKKEEGWDDLSSKPSGPPPDDGPWMWVTGKWVRIASDNDPEFWAEVETGGR